jgi:hypothetical protein
MNVERLKTRMLAVSGHLPWPHPHGLDTDCVVFEGPTVTVVSALSLALIPVLVVDATVDCSVMHTQSLSAVSQLG